MTLRGLHLHFDCASGIAGDMTLGALFMLGVPRDVVDRAIEAVGVEASRIRCESVVKGGIAARNVSVMVEPTRPHHHHHHSYADIRKMLDEADLEAAVLERASDMFARIARAEASLHGVDVDSVHFHEVGAIDSIVDVVGAAAGLAWLAPVEVTCASVAMGHGHVECEHGRLPVPSPAALEILREAGGVIEGGGVARELCTPTGAAILASTVTRWAPCPAMTPHAVGYGAGDIELDDRPNVVRIIAGRPAASDSAAGQVVVIEANIDDMTPEQASYVADRLFETGALDVWWTPIVMKKSRPAFQIGVLADPGRLDSLATVLLTESTTLGLRYSVATRRVLSRHTVAVNTEYGELQLVVASRDGVELRAVVEHGPARAAARQHGVPLCDVEAAAHHAYQLRRGK